MYLPSSLPAKKGHANASCLHIYVWHLPTISTNLLIAFIPEPAIQACPSSLHIPASVCRSQFFIRVLIKAVFVPHYNIPNQSRMKGTLLRICLPSLYTVQLEQKVIFPKLMKKHNPVYSIQIPNTKNINAYTESAKQFLLGIVTGR